MIGFATDKDSLMLWCEPFPGGILIVVSMRSEGTRYCRFQHVGEMLVALSKEFVHLPTTAATLTSCISLLR